MINVLRLLTLGGPRTWDANMYKQVRRAPPAALYLTAAARSSGRQHQTYGPKLCALCLQPAFCTVCCAARAWQRTAPLLSSVFHALHIMWLLPHAVVQLGMQAAPRPTPGVAGREVNLMVNHFALSIRPGSSMAVYSVDIVRSNEPQQQQQGAADSGKQQLPRGLAQRVVAQLAADAGWPSSWLLLGSNRLAAGRSFLPTHLATEALVSLQQQQRGQQQQGDEAAAGGSSSDTFKVSSSMLSEGLVRQYRSCIAAFCTASNSKCRSSVAVSMHFLLPLLWGEVQELQLHQPTAEVLLWCCSAMCCCSSVPGTAVVPGLAGHQCTAQHSSRRCSS
jgi:hypothetical protein